jgi:hypothetical protein
METDERMKCLPNQKMLKDLSWFPDPHTHCIGFFVLQNNGGKGHVKKKSNSIPIKSTSACKVRNRVMTQEVEEEKKAGLVIEATGSQPTDLLSSGKSSPLEYNVTICF